MKTILLVEDDKTVRENTQELLELSGYQVQTAVHGKEALQQLQSSKKQKPDLIICDIMMPQMDGYSLLAEVNKNKDTASIPFIFLSAKAEKSEIRQGMNLGADDYLTKPFQEEELLQAVDSRLKKQALLKISFEQNQKGLEQFLQEAKNLKVLDINSIPQQKQLYKKKCYVYHQGEQARNLYFVSKGSVKIFKDHEEGKEFLIEVCKAGHFFGYTALFQEQDYAESAMALEETELLKISENDFVSLLHKNPIISAKFIQLLSNNVIQRENQLLSIAYDTVRRRVGKALLQLAGQNKEVKITREDLANMAGTATETVIRCLSDFKDENLIKLDGKNIILVSKEELEEIF